MVAWFRGVRGAGTGTYFRSQRSAPARTVRVRKIETTTRGQHENYRTEPVPPVPVPVPVRTWTCTFRTFVASYNVLKPKYNKNNGGATYTQLGIPTHIP
jgi:hypothetical protein